MAETAITVDEVAGPYVAESSADQMTTLTQTAADITNGNVIDMAGRDVILFFENNDVAQQTVTITSSNDPYGRTADITAFTLEAAGDPDGADRVARKFSPLGWEDSTGSGRLLVTASDVDVLITAIRA